MRQESVHADSSVAFRAGTEIHEATHQQSYTGDYISADGTRIISSHESQQQPRKMNPDTNRPENGYHVPEGPDRKRVPKSEADLSAKYKKLRHTVINMEDNGDSFPVLAHLCSQSGVVPRDIELFSRALLEADAEDYLYLAKGASYALPKGHFAKKTIKAAAGEGTKPIKPSSHLAKGAVAKGAPAHAVYEARRKPSSLTALKGTAK
ncbi:hypothetical protein M413DRAFT_412238 [Hebeloma cylindrosporum]|uniref:Uncharacterized protein n=1 Tax=Hebeloma cylindrosporum TaxID=76867 RepID=A0A0C3CC36_HEBCY|nr:hypothetical protein M413DRAFT_412238 [Hebeloma cylindrosporum h7]